MTAARDRDAVEVARFARAWRITPDQARAMSLRDWNACVSVLESEDRERRRAMRRKGRR